MSPVDPPGSRADVARLLREVIAEIGPDAAPDEIVAAYGRYDRGLAAEDEFAVIVGWLGRCALVHKLDQRPSPAGADATYAVPDLLALMRFEGRMIPLLVEVKTSAKDTLSWSPRYRARLRAYGDALGLPVTVAWRHRGIWTWVDIHAFELARTNYKLDFSRAHQLNLMGVLAGDFIYSMAKNVGFHFTLRREEVVEDHGNEQTWRARVEEVYLTDAKGRRRDSMGSALFWMFGVTNPADVSDGSGDRVSQSFVIDDETGAQWAHRVLVTLLEIHSGQEGEINWRHLLGRKAPTFGRDDLRAAAEEGIAQDFVQYILDVVPTQLPAFLQSD